LHCAINCTTVCSIADTGLHSYSLKCVRMQRPTSHTRPCSSAIECTLVRSSALNSEASRDLFLGHLPLPQLISIVCHTMFSPIFSIFLPHPTLLSHQNTISQPKHTSITTASPSRYLRATTVPLPATPFFPIFFFLTNPTSPKFCILSPFFIVYTHKSWVQIVVSFCVGCSNFCRGLG
jgi:hypothetical protein